MTLKLFTQPNCPKCPSAKELCANLKFQAPRLRQGFGGQANLKFEEYDVTTVEGLAEASFYTVMATPSILIFDDSNKKIGDWRGEAPNKNDVIKILNIKDKNEKCSHYDL